MQGDGFFHQGQMHPGIPVLGGHYTPCQSLSANGALLQEYILNHFLNSWTVQLAADRMLTGCKQSHSRLYIALHHD